MAPTVSTMTHIAADVPEMNPLASEASAATNIMASTVPKMTLLASEAPAASEFPSSNTRQQSVLNVLIQNSHGYD